MRLSVWDIPHVSLSSTVVLCKIDASTLHYMFYLPVVMTNNATPTYMVSPTFHAQSWARFLVHDAWNIYADPRLLRWTPSGPWDLVFIVSLYLLFVLYWGPKFMKRREPYDLKKVIQYYNIANIVLCSIYSLAGFYVTRLTYDCWGQCCKLLCNHINTLSIIRRVRQADTHLSDAVWRSRLHVPESVRPTGHRVLCFAQEVQSGK